MEAKLHVVGFTNLAGRMGDLVFGTLILDRELSTISRARGEGVSAG